MAGAALMLTTACTGTGGLARAERAYPVPQTFDATRLLSPPPADAESQARDLEAVRSAQRSRTPEQAAHAEQSSAVDLFLFAAVLGPRFKAAGLPKTDAFLRRMYRSALPYLQETKECWNRERPFVVDTALTPLARSLASTRLRQPQPAAQSASRPAAAAPAASVRADSPCISLSDDHTYSPSYPSGHATVGAMLAIVLADMVPERRSALFECGWEYGEARIVSGVHFPSDVEAGRILGTTLVGMMRQDARFRADMNAARAELRQALDYNP